VSSPTEGSRADFSLNLGSYRLVCSRAAVSRRLLTAAARIRAQVCSCGIYGGQSGTVAGFLRVLQFPLPFRIPPIAPQSPSSVIWGWYNGPVVAAGPSGLNLIPWGKARQKLSGFSPQANYTERATAAC
jgi:hypothetical protein